MKSNYKLLVCIVVGILFGAAGNNAIHGQQVKTAPVYLISEADVITDPTGIKEYGGKVLETLTLSTAIIILSFGAVKQKAWMGTPTQGIVVIAFDSSEQAHAWYNSPAYAAIRPIRLAAVKGRMFVVEGVAQ